MKVKNEIVQKRRNDEMVLIQKLGTIDVATLENEFHVSAITIRRDLQYWEDKGAIIRNHGGAKLVQHMVSSESALSNDRYKHAIAKFAASFVEEGDTILINTSSTAMLVAQYVRGKHCTVITNNAKMLEVRHDPMVNIVLTGGELRFPKEAMVGDFALNNLKSVYANKCFLGCSGISAEEGITTAIFSETAINETMLNHTLGRKFILCDYTKIGLTYNYVSGTVNQIDSLITDINAGDEEIDALKEKNPRLEVIKVEPLSMVSLEDSFSEE
jgi:DeoR family fructose operon transcriptional repressor